MMIIFNSTPETSSEKMREHYSMTSANPVFTTTATIERVVTTMGYFLSAGSISIISTNLLVAIALVLLIRKNGYHSWCFALSLSIADILVGVAITGIAADALEGRTASMQKDICLLRMAFVIAPTAASILTMFFISMDRYVAIKFPLRYSQLMNEKMVAGGLVLLWLMSVTVGFLPCIVEPMQRKHYKNVCTLFSVIEPQSIIIVFCAFFFPLLSVFIYFYMDILKIACGHQQRIRQMGSRFLPPGRYWGHVKALRTVAVLVGCFTLCWCPFFVVSIVQVLCPTCKLYHFLENHLWLLGIANSLINPLVYACWQREVRNQISEVFAHIKDKLCCMTHSKTADRCHTDHTLVGLAVRLNDRTLPVHLHCSEPVTTPDQHPENNPNRLRMSV